MISLYVSCGANGGFRVEVNKRILRLCLWRVSIALVRLDVERTLVDSAETIKALKREVLYLTDELNKARR